MPLTAFLALLLRRLSNYGDHTILNLVSRLQRFARSDGKTFYGSMNRSPGVPNRGISYSSQTNVGTPDRKSPKDKHFTGRSTGKVSGVKVTKSADTG